MDNKTRFILFLYLLGEVTNRGTGISVSDNLMEIKKIVSDKSKHLHGKEKTFII